MKLNDVQAAGLTGAFGLVSGLLSGNDTRQKLVVALAGGIVSYGALKATHALKNWFGSTSTGSSDNFGNDDNDDGDPPRTPVPDDGGPGGISLEIPGLLEKGENGQLYVLSRAPVFAELDA
jgi:hypothetical protein